MVYLLFRNFICCSISVLYSSHLVVPIMVANNGK